MKEHQAREYIFEESVNKILESSGGIWIKNETLLGRSGDHKIYAYGANCIPTPFIYPIRIICQYKYYAKNKVELAHIRDFNGIVNDISERNFSMIHEMENTPDRFTDIGCYFSATAFSKEAQEYAWAHNIFLMSLERITVLQPMLKKIEEFVGSLSESIISNITRDELISGYEGQAAGEGVIPEAVIGIVNGVYPIMIFGVQGWFTPVLEEARNSEVGRVFVE